MKLYLIHLPAQPVDTKIFDQLLAQLDEDAQSRVKRFRLPEDALRSVVGRLAPIWCLLQNSLVTSSSTPKFDIKGKGKPTLVEPALDPPTAFNTSHDGNYVLLGVTRGEGSDIGVDLMEYPSDAWEIQEGISDQLTREEKAVLALPMSNEERSRLVTRLWTLKEGYVKATGDGIGFGLERIVVDIEQEGQVQSVHVDGRDVKVDGWDWCCGTIEAADQSKAFGWAVYWKKDTWSGDLEHVSWEEFIKPFQTS